MTAMTIFQESDVKVKLKYVQTVQKICQVVTRTVKMVDIVAKILMALNHVCVLVNGLGNIVNYHQNALMNVEDAMIALQSTNACKINNIISKFYFGQYNPLVSGVKMDA